jgi:hypothetical protein
MKNMLYDAKRKIEGGGGVPTTSLTNNIITNDTYEEGA